MKCRPLHTLPGTVERRLSGCRLLETGFLQGMVEHNWKVCSISRQLHILQVFCYIVIKLIPDQF